MRGFVTTLGTAAVLGAAALGLATSASADGGNAADRRADRFHECMVRAQASGMPLTGATIEGCVVVMNMMGDDN